VAIDVAADGDCAFDRHDQPVLGGIPHVRVREELRLPQADNPLEIPQGLPHFSAPPLQQIDINHTAMRIAGPEDISSIPCIAAQEKAPACREEG